jgi:hypothetical protein
MQLSAVGPLFQELIHSTLFFLETRILEYSKPNIFPRPALTQTGCRQEPMATRLRIGVGR